MPARRRRAASAAVAACLISVGSPLVGQATGTLDIGASYVEYDGFLPSGAATVGSALGWDAPNLSLAGQAHWTIFESGNQNVQATGAAAWLSPGEWLRLELSGTGGASKYATHQVAGHVLGRTRLHLFGDHAGGWLGVTTGGSFAEAGDVPLEVALGLWTVREQVAVVGSVTGTRLGASRYADLIGAVRWTGPRLEVEARAGVRPWVRAPDRVGEPVTGVYGDVSALLALGPRIGLSVSGGNYPADPVRRVIAAKYLSLGLQLNVFGMTTPPTALLPRVTAPAADPVEGSANAPRIEVGTVAGVHVVRVYAHGAGAIELMADFTDWGVVALAEMQPGIWEIQLPLTPGVHRVNIRVDGGPWVVPVGARPEESEFGGAVGLIVVKPLAAQPR